MGSPPTSPLGGLPLSAGSRGDAVLDLQHRLRGSGLEVDPAESGRFGPSTEQALRSFQEQRGLVADGVCDHVAWHALVEAGYVLGDRLLYLRHPMLRGEDVADLQKRLGHLGFDAGRVDGIFGPQAESAVRDFQRNLALTVDGVCGPDVINAFGRLGGRGAGTAVATVREGEALRRGPRLLADQRVVVGEDGGVEVLAQATARALQDLGAVAATFSDPDGSVLARDANGFAAAVYVGLSVSTDGPGWVAYYSTEGFESVGGRRLAESVSVQLAALEAVAAAPPRGLRLPVLRETRMTAVLCHLGPADAAVRHGAAVAAAIAAGVSIWAEAPVGG